MLSVIVGLDFIVNFDDAYQMGYPGGKGKCYQHIINVMQPHEVYIETHLGGGAVMLHKRPAKRNIGIDIDRKVIDTWKKRSDPVCELICEDALKFLRAYPFQGTEVVYSDPPYLPETRRKRRIYRHDYSVDDHIELLLVMASLPCQIMISAYPSKLYQQYLPDWHYMEFPGVSHTGKRTESLWLNFIPGALHDYRHLGRDFRERQSIKRMKKRWRTKLELLPPLERRAIIEDLLKLDSSPTTWRRTSE